MKTKIKILTVSTLSLMGLFLSIAANSATIPENHCLPDYSSKRYITKNFSENYPREAKFKCNYDCMVNGKKFTVTGISNVRVHNIDEDARMMACQGVKVKKVAWGHDYDGEKAFYAFDSNILELKEFAFKNISQRNKTEIEYLNNFKKKIYQVAPAYAATTVPHFVEAAEILNKMAQQLPSNTELLDLYIEKINNNALKSTDYTAENLVLAHIIAHASWRIPLQDMK